MTQRLILWYAKWGLGCLEDDYIHLLNPTAHIYNGVDNRPLSKKERETYEADLQGIRSQMAWIDEQIHQIELAARREKYRARKEAKEAAH